LCPQYLGAFRRFDWRNDRTPPEITSNVGVLEDAGGHEWMGHLQEHRRSAPQKRDEWRVPSLLITLSGAK
jgi:hypothetical protein